MLGSFLFDFNGIIIAEEEGRYKSELAISQRKSFRNLWNVDNSLAVEVRDGLSDFDDFEIATGRQS